MYDAPQHLNLLVLALSDLALSLLALFDFALSVLALFASISVSVQFQSGTEEVVPGKEEA
jgi:hypothetical protein